MPKSKSYEVCHCGANCSYLSDDSAPCWGEVEPFGISGDIDFKHVCRGHYPLCWEGEYDAEEEERAEDAFSGAGIAIIGDELIKINSNPPQPPTFERLGEDGKYHPAEVIGLDAVLVGDNSKFRAYIREVVQRMKAAK